MSISKIKQLQGQISTKFKVYTSFTCQQGFDNKGRIYTKITVYDSIHSHRHPKSMAAAVEDLHSFLNMDELMFKYG